MDIILTINTGSTTIKFAVFSLVNDKLTKKYDGAVGDLSTKPNLKIKSCHDNSESIIDFTVSGAQDSYCEQAIRQILDWIKAQGFNIVAAGHRIVHGGPDYTSAVILDDAILENLLKLADIMPLHQPFNIKGVKILQKEHPNLLQVGCFDTMFHATCNPISQHYPLPKRLTDKGIRRYGFHGLSYEYIASKLPKEGKFVVAHLGGGASMCAIKNQKSLATCMGFTGVDGLPMGTRCGSLDPGLVLYLMDTYNLNTSQMLNLFYKESGLLGVSGISSDMRELLASDKPEAKLAVDIFVHRVVVYTGFLAAELQGLDGFVFTGGIGENAAPIREQVCERLTWLGMELDKAKNQQHINKATQISSKKSQIPIWVIPTDEELMIARHTLHAL